MHLFFTVRPFVFAVEIAPLEQETQFVVQATKRCFFHLLPSLQLLVDPPVTSISKELFRFFFLFNYCYNHVNVSRSMDYFTHSLLEYSFDYICVSLRSYWALVLVINLPFRMHLKSFCVGFSLFCSYSPFKWYSVCLLFF